MEFLFTKTPLLFFVQSLWRDEAFSYFLAKKNLFVITQLTARDFNPPLYYYLLHVWMKIFGGSEVALRSLSLVFYVGSLFFIFLFYKKIFNIKSKRIYAYLLFAVINPFLLYYAFEARMYSQLVFMAIASYYFLLKKSARLYMVFAILGLYTHYFMALVIFTQFLFLYLSDKKKQTLFKYCFWLTIFFLPWCLFVLIQNHSLGTQFWILSKPLIEVLYIPIQLLTGYETDYNYLNQSKFFYPQLFFLISLLIGLSTAIFYQQLKKNPLKKKLSLFYLLIFWSFLPPLIVFLVSFIKPVFLSRYLIFSSAGLTLLLIFMAEHQHRFRFLLLLVAVFLLSYQQLEIQYWKKTDFITTARKIKLFSNKNDLYYVTSELDYFTVQYYLGEDRVYIFSKTYREIPDYVGKVLIPATKIATSIPSYPRRAFVLDSFANFEIISR